MSSAVELVVTDLDGTLSDAGERVHPRAARAVRALQTAGVPVLVATGRRPRAATWVLEVAGLTGPAVMLDGSIGRDLRDGRTFHRVAYTAEAAATVLEIFDACGLEPCVYVERPDADIVVGDHPSTHPMHLARAAAGLARDDLERVVATEPVLAFAVVGREAALLRPAARALTTAGAASCSITRDLVYDSWTLQVRPFGVSKWSGVLSFCADQGLDPGRVLAVGDGANDTELLQAASIACAVAGGAPAALEHADHLIEPPATGGWAAILDLVTAVRRSPG